MGNCSACSANTLTSSQVRPNLAAFARNLMAFETRGLLTEKDFAATLPIAAGEFGCVIDHRRPPCRNTPSEAALCPMKLRFDLATQVTPEMVEQEALANQHRYKAEPLFSQTGIGSLSSASTSDSAAEAARSTERIQKLMSESGSNGSNSAPAK